MFSVIIPDRPCLADPVAVDAQPNGQATKFAFNFPLNPSFKEVVVFLLPGIVLPPETAAAVYIQFPDPNGPEFRFIGALANEKPSSILSVRPPPRRRTEAEEEDDMLDEGANNPAAGNAAPPDGMVTLGISIEPVQTVAPQLATLEAEKSNAGPSDGQQGSQLPRNGISTKVLAQRIIGNAFNFLGSFASTDNDAVPLKAFRDWWAKFERKVDLDPSFLEREDPTATA